jgi:hypothetical protein
MKYLISIGNCCPLFTAIVLNPSMKPKSIEERVQVQLEESEALHDSAMLILQEIHDKNDSLIDAYFPAINTAK